MAGGTHACINLITSDRKQSSVAKLFMMPLCDADGVQSIG
jgi:hypothetical protein